MSERIAHRFGQGRVLRLDHLQLEANGCERLSDTGVKLTAEPLSFEIELANQPVASRARAPDPCGQALLRGLQAADVTQQPAVQPQQPDGLLGRPHATLDLDVAADEYGVPRLQQPREPDPDGPDVGGCGGEDLKAVTASEGIDEPGSRSETGPRRLAHPDDLAVFVALKKQWVREHAETGE